MNQYFIQDYVPHRGQFQLHQLSKEDKYKEIVVVSSIRSGKSYGIIHDVITASWNNKTPHGILVCAPTFRLLESVLERDIVTKLQSFGLVKNHSFMRHETELKNGNRIFYRSLEEPDTALRGLNICKAYVDECAYVDKYAMDVVRGRLLTTNGQLIMITTPKGTNNWLYEDYFVNKREDVAYLKFSILDNPIISQEAVERLKRSYDELMYRQEILGEFINLFQNQVYYSFSDLNVIDEYYYDPFSPIYVGLDFNIDKNAWIAVQKKPDNTFVAFMEGYGAKTTADVAQQILQKFGKGVIVIPDATGRNRLQGTAVTNFQLLEQAGISQIVENRSNPNRLKRYSVVNASLKNAIGERRLYLSRTGCPQTIKELYELSYIKGKDKVDDVQQTKGHRTDSLGYVMMFLTGGEVGKILNKDDNFVKDFLARHEQYQESM